MTTCIALEILIGESRRMPLASSQNLLLKIAGELDWFPEHQWDFAKGVWGACETPPEMPTRRENNELPALREKIRTERNRSGVQPRWPHLHFPLSCTLCSPPSVTLTSFLCLETSFPSCYHRTFTQAAPTVFVHLSSLILGSFHGSFKSQISRKIPLKA